MKTYNFLMVVLDWIGAILSWILFFYFRKSVEVEGFKFVEIFNDKQLIIGLLIIPLFWTALWSFHGMYLDVLRKSRINVAYRTILGTLIGCAVLFFTIIRDDLTIQLVDYLLVFIILVLIHLGIFLLIRMGFLSILKSMMQIGKISFQALLYGEVSKSWGKPQFTEIAVRRNDCEIFDQDKNWTENIIIGEMAINDLQKCIPMLIGNYPSAEILIHDSTYGKLEKRFEARPSLRSNYLSLKTSPIPTWQRVTKRFFDIIVSCMALILTSPITLLLSILVKKSSPGPVIYKQERIGKGGKSFMIYKFRSMHDNAETQGPALAQKNDGRCTPLGRWMRRWRLDEMPQFYNVFKGDMSFVGPRPERPFFTGQLIERNSMYPLLWQVKPGITSWGQIKFGYASTLDDMAKRFRYDLLYLEHMSIFLDLRILYYTLIVLFQGKGR